jgi:hypothetical protein
MPTLQELQRGRTSIGTAKSRISHLQDEELVTDQRCEMSPAQCVEEKLLRLLQLDEHSLRTSLPARRPR